ncbi:MAG: glycosyltransferase family 1 protein [Candidatus Thermoplasmatota archaeon]
MKVALVAGRNVMATGIDRYVRSLASELKNEGVDVQLIVQQRREMKLGPMRVGGFLSLYAARFARRPAGVDIVHALDPAVAGPRTDVVTVHDIIAEQFPQWYLRDVRAKVDWAITRHYARSARLLIADSEATRAEIIERWHVPADRVRVAHLGVDASFFAPAGEPSKLLAAERSNVVYVGDDNPRKNIALVVEALALLRIRGVNARFLRLGPSRFPKVHDAYRQRAKETGVDLVEPGFVSDAEVHALLTHAQAFVWPSLAEGFGLPPLEAMACGLPVVALDTLVNREVLAPLARFHPDDARAAADAIEETLRAPRRSDDLRAHAKTFDRTRTARETLAAYEEVMRR